MPSAKPPKRADATRIRKRVLEAARARVASGDLRLFLNELARDIGVGVGTVYRHFGSRPALGEALASGCRQAELHHNLTSARLARDDSPIGEAPLLFSDTCRPARVDIRQPQPQPMPIKPRFFGLFR